MHLRTTLDDADTPDILDRILDKGLSIDMLTVLGIKEAELSSRESVLRVSDLSTNTDSYAQQAAVSRYFRFTREEYEPE